MIRYREPLSMTESLEFMEDKEDTETDIKKFVKKFVKMKPEEGKKIREKLSSLGLIKMKAESISKVIDLMPENQENLNKIFTDVSLDDDESKKILETIGEFK